MSPRPSFCEWDDVAFQRPVPCEKGDLTYRFCSLECAQTALAYEESLGRRCYESEYELHGGHPDLLPWDNVLGVDVLRAKTLREHETSRLDEPDWEEEWAKRRPHERAYAPAPKTKLTAEDMKHSAQLLAVRGDPEARGKKK
jgi:hypothetical protein